MKLAVGNSDFKKIRQNGHDFVDKTLFIKEVLEDKTEAFLITRPRRFGKTFNMSILRHFFDMKKAKENKPLFENTLIASATLNNGTPCMDFQGQFPVLFMTLKDVRATNYENMYRTIANEVSELYTEHSDLLLAEPAILNDREKVIYQQIIERKAEEEDLQVSLKKITKYLHRFHKKPVVVLMDEYDTPMHSTFESTPPYHETLLPFMRNFMSAVFKDNTHLHKGILTGILRISLMNLFSGMNSIPVYSMLSRNYASHFGFTETEVDQLLAKVDFPCDKDAIKNWYNGYEIEGIVLYNPWSIVRCLQEGGKLQPYWLGSGEHGILGKALMSLLNQTIFEQLKTLMEGGSIKVEIDERTLFANIERNARALWSLMLYSGYLKAIGSKVMELKTFHQLMIPNREVKRAFLSIIDNWSCLPGTDQSIYNALVESLSTGDIDQFQYIIEHYIEETISFYDFERGTKEKFYHIFLLGMLIMLKDKFIVISNREAGLGRSDITLIPQSKTNLKHGVILELKSIQWTGKKRKHAEISEEEEITALETSAKLALDQIDKQHYRAALTQQGIFQAVHIGMAFSGKRVEVAYKTVDYSPLLQPSTPLDANASSFFSTATNHAENTTHAMASSNTTALQPM